jgi:hypothetical protein
MRPRPVTIAAIAPTLKGALPTGAVEQPTLASAVPSQPLASQWPSAFAVYSMSRLSM